MIGLLRGRVALDDPCGAVVLDVGGVGYELATPVGTLGRARKEGQDVVLHVHTHVRQDMLALYGFASEQERRIFRLLIEVPNVGPKTALGLLSALPAAELSQAVSASDIARLTRVPGIGKKTAERLVLELKEKLPGVSPLTEAGPAPARTDDARKLHSALTNMGYRAGEADRAIKTLADRLGREPLTNLLREALALLTP
jgi:Holliday junction DNA helicase RuvA